MLQIAKALLETKQAPEVMTLLMSSGMSSLDAAALICEALKPAGRIQMQKVVILWSEGLAEEDIEFTSWQAVNDTLWQIALDNDKDGYTGCYAKTKFRLTWADGETYEGRLDVNTKEDYDLGQHILDHLNFYGGLHCPAHWNEEEYQRFIHNDNNPQEYIDYLNKYEIVTGTTPRIAPEPVKVTPEPQPEIKPQAGYVEGAIVEHNWGYDQTNIDYYLITRRTEKGYLYLQPIGSKTTETGWLTGNCEPDPTNLLDREVVRRRVITRGNEEIGVGSPNGCGWASLWDGRPGSWSNYA